MCGIAALWDSGTDARDVRAAAEAMARSLAHRGPDGAGSASPAGPGVPVALAHRRLAIRGLGPQGAQPMRGLRGDLSFNGELFAVEDLRARLLASGHRFVGSSDTEVLLRALDEWGVQGALERIRGQFAFAWWSDAERALYLARDRVGIRPLYYASAPGRLAAASEQKALLTLPWLETSPDVEAGLSFLVMGRTDDVPYRTMLAGIRSLPAAHWLRYDGKRVETRRYDRFGTEPPPSDPARLREELERAVEEQLVSDVAIGATVSGGLDSSTVALLADRVRLRRGSGETLHLFAYHDRSAEQDERPFQHAVIDAVRSPHEVHWVSSSPEEIGREFDAYLDAQEEPYADFSSYAEFCIARRAREVGVKVLLNGLGGDEVFTGYESFLGPLALDVLRSGSVRALRDLLASTPEVLGRRGTGWRPLAAAAYHALPRRFRQRLSARRNARRAGIPERWRRVAENDAATRWHPHDGRGHLNAALRGAVESWCIPRFLAHSDRMGLAHGVEGRVPLLDDGVIAAAWGIPPADRVGRSGLKASLRAAARDLLPPPVLSRAWKLGFHTPLRVYLAAVEPRLREGIRVAREHFPDAPDWDELADPARWRWGIYGVYLDWVRARRSSPAGVA